MWILCLAEDSLETSSLIFSEKQWKNIYECCLLQLGLALQIAEFANSIDLDEVAHDEPPHLDLYCLPSSLWILNII